MKALSQEDFAELERRFTAGDRNIKLPVFIQTLRQLPAPHDGGGGDAGHKQKSRFSEEFLKSTFHQIDYKDRKTITWDEFSMFLIDDVLRGESLGGGSGADVSGEPGRVDRFHVAQVIPQVPVGRANAIQFVPAWNKMLRLTTFNGLSNIELCDPQTLVPVKASAPQPVPVVATACIPELSLVAAANADISCSFWTTQSLLEETARDELFLVKRVGLKTLECSLQSLLWHPRAQRLYGGSLFGEVVLWSLPTLDKAASGSGQSSCAQFDIARRYRFQAHAGKGSPNDKLGITALVPWDERLVTGGMAGRIHIFDCEKECVLETLHGHTQGILALARSDYGDVLVSAGFERDPFIWGRHMKEQAPFRLIDKSDPHKTDVIFLHCPVNTPQIVSADANGLVKVWDIRTYHCVQTVATDRYHRCPTAAAASGPSLSKTTATSDAQFCHVTYDAQRSSLALCGPRCTLVLRGDLPQYMSSADDKPVIRAFYNECTRTFVSAHGRSVKVWDEHTGAILATYANLTPADITVLCLDHRGRKFFVADRRGNVQGHVLATGAKYREFRQMPSAVIDMCYSVFRSGRKYLVACCKESHDAGLVAFEDADDDCRAQPITHPRTLVGALLAKREAADGHPALPVEFSSVCTQNKLSLVFVAARHCVVAIDVGSLGVVHVFQCDADVVAVAPLGDLPAVAIVDRSGWLRIYAVRPSLSAEKLLAQVRLRGCAEPSCAATCLTFHQNKRRLFIGDTSGGVEVWQLTDFVKACGLAPASYPMSSIAETVLRKRHDLPNIDDANAGIVYVHTLLAHTDEVNNIAVVVAPHAVMILTSSYDHCVRLWDAVYTPLGELSQGRMLEPEKAVDQLAVREHYARYRLTPFLLDSAEPEDDVLDLSDFSDLVIGLLRRATHRFRARKRRERGEVVSLTAHHKGVAPSPVDAPSAKRKPLSAAGNAFANASVSLSPASGGLQLGWSQSPGGTTTLNLDRSGAAPKSGSDDEGSDEGELSQTMRMSVLMDEARHRYSQAQPKRSWDVLTKISLGEKEVAGMADLRALRPARSTAGAAATGGQATEGGAHGSGCVLANRRNDGTRVPPALRALLSGGAAPPPKRSAATTGGGATVPLSSFGAFLPPPPPPRDTADAATTTVVPSNTRHTKAARDDVRTHEAHARAAYGSSIWQVAPATAASGKQASAIFQCSSTVPRLPKLVLPAPHAAGAPMALTARETERAAAARLCAPAPPPAPQGATARPPNPTPRVRLGLAGPPQGPPSPYPLLVHRPLDGAAGASSSRFSGVRTVAYYASS